MKLKFREFWDLGGVSSKHSGRYSRFWEHCHLHTVLFKQRLFELSSPVFNTMKWLLEWLPMTPPGMDVQLPIDSKKAFQASVMSKKRLRKLSFRCLKRPSKIPRTGSPNGYRIYSIKRPGRLLLKFLDLESGRLFEAGRLLNFHNFHRVASLFCTQAKFRKGWENRRSVPAAHAVISKDTFSAKNGIYI